MAPKGNESLTTQDIDAILTLAREAGAIAIAMRADATIETKTSATDLVTSADKALSALLMQNLAERFADDVVLSEESPWQATEAGKRRWIIDPIDGTKYYVDNTGKWAVMIGLVENGREVFGCFYMPAYDEALLGGPGIGAWRYKDGQLTQIEPQTQSMPVATAEKPLRVMVSNNDLNANPWLKDLAGVELVVASSIGVDVYELLADRADVFVHIRPTLGFWDTAAPGPVASALGFEVGGDKLDYIHYPDDGEPRHQPAIVIGKTGALKWWRTLERPSKSK